MTLNRYSVVHDKKDIFFSGKLHLNVLLDRKLFIVNIIVSCLSGGRCDLSKVTLHKKLATQLTFLIDLLQRELHDTESNKTFVMISGRKWN